MTALLIMIIVAVCSFVIGLLVGETLTQRNCPDGGFLHFLGRGEVAPPKHDPLIKKEDFWNSTRPKPTKRKSKGKRKGK